MQVFFYFPEKEEPPVRILVERFDFIGRISL